jgi:uncharacterized protein (DUF169 family)
MNTREIGLKLKNDLGLKYFPIGILFSDRMPDNAKKFMKKGAGCIVPLIFSSAKGDIVAIDKDSTGWDCSAFYLGYQDWIFEGIECFLADGVVFGRNGERFIKTKSQAKEYVKSFKPKELNTRVTIFKPLEKFTDEEDPEVVLFFVTPDELSGLVFLLHYNSPDKDDVVISRFLSGCGSIVTMPMKYRVEGTKKAVMGMFDISARLRLPKDILTLAMPVDLLIDMYKEIDKSFIITDNWKNIKERNRSEM